MRRKRRNVTVAQPAKTRSELEALHGRVWDTAELARELRHHGDPLTARSSCTARPTMLLAR